LNELNHRYRRNITLHVNTLQVLEHYSWPGNVRQLQNVLERAMLMADDELITQEQVARILAEQSAVRLPDEVPGHGSRFTSTPASQDDTGQTGVQTRSYQWVHHDDAQRIQEALKHTRGNQAGAARKLNMTVRQLRYRIAKLGLNVARH
ncbi:MAG TPA: helix-turn-helix domain-containing protein, partial [Thioalkalivibrio sp.]|nr:helix-turn-helix domain-containing protein [Thioalkalivibrio sp.]